jgi:hypothetical protein
MNSYFTRLGLRVWMARFNDWKELIPQDYNVMIIILGLA